MKCTVCGQTKKAHYFKKINNKRIPKCRLCVIKDLHKYYTPFGNFDTLKDAAQSLKVSTSFIKNVCHNNDKQYTNKTHESLKETPVKDINNLNKTYNELGYYEYN